MILQATMDVLKKFYDRKKASLLRTAASASTTAKLSVVASEVKSVATTMLEGGDSTLSFGNAQSSEMRGVAAGGAAELKARAKELAKEAAKPKVALVKQKAEVKPAEPNINPDAVADFMDTWQKIPFRKSAALLQSNKKAMKPSASAAKLLKEAQSTHADAQAIIAQAKAIAGKKTPKAMLQQSQPAGPPPPPGFKAKKDSAMSGGITVMLTNMLDDIDAMIEEAVKDEADALTAYEGFMKESNEVLAQMKEHITSLQEEIAKAEQEKELKEQELKDALDEKKFCVSKTSTFGELRAVSTCWKTMTFVRKNVKRKLIPLTSRLPPSAPEAATPKWKRSWIQRLRKFLMLQRNLTCLR